ncbi:hypothetical protein C8J56DRAFT_1040185 [Mycena floridula]|nr:hypothetical protein C8J56DRAFT_1040185 [Mycena floridula]
MRHTTSPGSNSDLDDASLTTGVEPLTCNHCGNQYIQHIPAAPVQDLPHLSHTNNAPTTAELATVKTNILNHQDEIQALQADVEKLQKALDVSKLRKSVAEKALLVQEGITHPLRKFPSELLREIFKACMEDWGENVRRYAYRPHSLPPLPWNISHVSRRWREISISFQQLWTVIYQCGTFLPEKPTRLMIDRSGTLPLEITLRQMPYHGLGDHHIMRTIVPTSSRWSRLELSISDLEALTPVHGHLDALEDLRFAFTTGTSLETPFTMFQIAPALRKVEIFQEERSYTVPNRKMLLPWHQITHYTVNSPQTTDFTRPTDDFSILLEPIPLCVNLTEAYLHQINFLAAGKVPLDIILPKLTLLSLTTVEPGSLAVLLNKLRVPALEALRLHSQNKCDEADQQSIESLVSRSQCPLTSFQLSSLLAKIHPSLIIFLSNASSITKLSLSGDSYALLQHLHSSAILSNLKIVEMIGPAYKQSVVNLADMVESRLDCASIQEIHVPGWMLGHIEEPGGTRLERLRETGIRFIEMRRYYG